MPKNFSRETAQPKSSMSHCAEIITSRWLDEASESQVSDKRFLWVKLYVMIRWIIRGQYWDASGKACLTQERGVWEAGSCTPMSAICPHVSILYFIKHNHCEIVECVKCCIPHNTSLIVQMYIHCINSSPLRNLWWIVLFLHLPNVDELTFLWAFGLWHFPTLTFLNIHIPVPDQNNYISCIFLSAHDVSRIQVLTF